MPCFAFAAAVAFALVHPMKKVTVDNDASDYSIDVFLFFVLTPCRCCLSLMHIVCLVRSMYLLSVVMVCFLILLAFRSFS